MTYAPRLTVSPTQCQLERLSPYHHRNLQHADAVPHPVTQEWNYHAKLQPNLSVYVIREYITYEISFFSTTVLDVSCRLTTSVSLFLSPLHSTTVLQFRWMSRRIAWPTVGNLLSLYTTNYILPSYDCSLLEPLTPTHSYKPYQAVGACDKPV
ncbi:hypothetical protein BDN72DRAFT_124733 [Pluteus cervinus]|uniref:Uncharacterized protein n=1 Tax=Pluteus cervinus TaxID=181527 RepID=A0ACD3ANC5_9AGAR|nr:hypothetical protein BDN72DRAFT_124733 [Pluteus cervinus]